MTAISIVLAITAGLLGVLFLIAANSASRRGARLTELDAKLRDQSREAEEARRKLEEKCHSLDELRSKLDRSKDEARRAKKKAHELGQSEPPEAIEAAERSREEELLEARAAARRAAEQAEAAAGEARKAREQAERLKVEVAASKQALDEARARPVERARPAPAPVASQEAELRRELDSVKKQLERAQRKARTDAQVYRVTNSKLDLAMERIATMERMLQRARGEAPPSEPVSPAEEAAAEAEALAEAEATTEPPAEPADDDGPGEEQA